jgi:hypothetical protein
MGRLTAFACTVTLLCVLVAGAGALTAHGGRGADVLHGGKRADTLKGLRGRDRLFGGRGGDLLIGGKGDDRLIGGAGRDSFNMRRGVELPSPGNDRIEARNNDKDAINCGAGVDVAIVDKVEDGVYFCEKVKEPK